VRGWWSDTWIVPLVLFWAPLATLLATFLALVWFVAMGAPALRRQMESILGG